MKGIKNLLGGLILVIVLIVLNREIFPEEKPVSTKRNSYVWAWVCILALAVLGLMNKCAFGQVPVYYAGLQEGMLGQTVCDKAGNIAILINSGYNFDSAGLRTVVDHENVHVGQIRSLGGCVEAGKVYAKDPMAQEIPAYCAELKARMVAGNAIEVLTKFIMHMKMQYGRDMTIEQITEKVYKHCPMGGSNDSS